MNEDVDDRLRSAHHASEVLLDVPHLQHGDAHRAIEGRDTRHPDGRSAKTWGVTALAGIIAAALLAGTVLAMRATGESHARATSAAAPQSPIAMPLQFAGPASSVTSASRPAHEVLRNLRSGEDPTVGVAYRFELLIHCGIRYTTFGSQTWEADAPVPRLGGAQPDANGQTVVRGVVSGSMTLVSPQRVVFVLNDPYYAKANGTTISFRPTGVTVPLCL